MLERTIELINDSMKATIIPFESLRIGDIFRMYEPDGSLVTNSLGKSEFIVRSEPAGEPLGVRVDTV